MNSDTLILCYDLCPDWNSGRMRSGNDAIWKKRAAGRLLKEYEQRDQQLLALAGSQRGQMELLECQIRKDTEPENTKLRRERWQVIRLK